MVRAINTKSSQRGFTLLELLVVIAIIGLLSSIVFGMLGNSRTKSQNSKIRQQLSSVRTAANLYFTRTGNYGAEVIGSCTTGGAQGPNHSYMFRDTTSGMYNLMGVTANWPASVSRTCYVSSTGQRWAVSVSLVGGGEGGFTNWCVDSQGNSQGRNVPITNANGC